MKSLVILAGGLGTRLRPIINDVPKPMAPVLGKPFIYHLMHFYSSREEIEFIISVGYKSNTVVDYFGFEFQGSKIKYVNESEPLGTGGALLNVLDSGLIRNEFFFLVNGDSFIDYDFNSMLCKHIESNAALTIGTMRANQADRYGGIKLEEGSKRVLGFTSDKCGKGETANAGTYIFSRSKSLYESLSKCGQKFSLESNFLTKYVKNASVNSFEMSGSFLDIGVPSDYQKVDEFFAQRMV